MFIIGLARRDRELRLPSMGKRHPTHVCVVLAWRLRLSERVENRFLRALILLCHIMGIACQTSHTSACFTCLSCSTRARTRMLSTKRRGRALFDRRTRPRSRHAASYTKWRGGRSLPRAARLAELDHEARHGLPGAVDHVLGHVQHAALAAREGHDRVVVGAAHEAVPPPLRPEVLELEPLGGGLHDLGPPHRDVADQHVPGAPPARVLPALQGGGREVHALAEHAL